METESLAEICISGYKVIWPHWFAFMWTLCRPLLLGDGQNKSNLQERLIAWPGLNEVLTLLLIVAGLEDKIARSKDIPASISVWFYVDLAES